MSENLITISWAQPRREIRITASKPFVVGTALSFSGPGGDEYRAGDKTPSFVLAKSLRAGVGINEVTVKPCEATLLLEPGTIWYFIRQPVIDLLLQQLGWTMDDCQIDDQATAEEVTMLGLQYRIQRGLITPIDVPEPSTFVNRMSPNVHGGVVRRVGDLAIEHAFGKTRGSMPPSGYCD